ncbi:ABC-2 type transport system permease protein [Sphingomonas gellani]|uniref:ABC-2 type transport system permease protein n=1 Tax=Sphingomonas gellani TaxID=1166340 RepID=A0A1H8G400_9SPHN|nr:ABC transporter permease [Sphingomonas gellani]SEN38514.1 ABC-2 type transport system permease protein [Sphingomonas gellani]
MSDTSRNRLRRSIRQTLTIARRDFIATVFTPIFLLFLFAPMIFGVIGGTVGGMSAASMAGGGDRSRIVAIVAADQARTVADADRRLRAVFRDSQEPPPLTTLSPAANPAAQARAAFSAKDYDAAAVLYGPLDRPTILFGGRSDRTADYLATMAAETLAAERLGGRMPAVAATKTRFVPPHPAAGPSNRPNPSAFFAVFGIFFLTLFLSGQVVGTMAEERSNKVVEVLAAAVPLESVFLGKLLGMFGVAILFVGFWGTVVGNLGLLLPGDMGRELASITPAVGAAPFSLLFAAYFTTAYLLLGSVFLGVGAQASTMREIQLLSLPITFVQMSMFGLAAAAAGRPGSWIASMAEVFPLSSPFAMAGRAANRAELWPHVAAIAWQLLWVAVFITVGARLFRRGVLQSGSARPWWRRRRVA